jgi:5-methyltetrahydropteroyltriglutamate--homocysteine methyltransferase
MTIPTEPIGSIPRPAKLIEAIATHGIDDPSLKPLFERFEATRSPVITDGEQRKYHNFWTYSVHGLPNAAADGFKIPFVAGHTRRMLRLTGGPFRYQRYADSYLDLALRYAHVPVKQAVISPSALSLMYPPEAIPGYPRETCSASTRPRFAPACLRVRIRCRSTSQRVGSRSRSTPREIFFTVLLISTT